MTPSAEAAGSSKRVPCSSLVVGDIRDTLPRTLQRQSTQVETLVHDSLHTYAHEWFEYETAYRHRGRFLLLIANDTKCYIDIAGFRDLPRRDISPCEGETFRPFLREGNWISIGLLQGSSPSATPNFLATRPREQHDLQFFGANRTKRYHVIRPAGHSRRCHGHRCRHHPRRMRRASTRSGRAFTIAVVTAAVVVMVRQYRLADSCSSHSLSCSVHPWPHLAPFRSAEITAWGVIIILLSLVALPYWILRRSSSAVPRPPSVRRGLRRYRWCIPLARLALELSPRLFLVHHLYRNDRRSC